MSGDTKTARENGDIDAPAYAAPALEKGLDILELLARSNVPLSQKEIAQKLGRTIGELYRMVMCLVERGYLVNLDDRFIVSTKLFWSRTDSGK